MSLTHFDAAGKAHMVDVSDKAVTAREAVEARRNAEAWSTPRCMTEREYGRLVATANTRAGL